MFTIQFYVKKSLQTIHIQVFFKVFVGFPTLFLTMLPAQSLFTSMSPDNIKFEDVISGINFFYFPEGLGKKIAKKLCFCAHVFKII